MVSWLALLENQIVSAPKAFKGKDYLCPECRTTVRLRSGPHRKPHFYHLNPTRPCRQHLKSEEHLQAQLAILNALPAGEGQIERIFSSINRIADVAWEARKIIFEIQCSPISLDEVKQRVKDYQAYGFEVVWILHDKRFNMRRVSAAEMHLRQQTCYFTNMSKEGKGAFYDQFEIIKGHLRLFKSPPTRINPTQLIPTPVSFPTPLPHSLAGRAQIWHHATQGDLLSKIARKELPFLSKWKELEERIECTAIEKRSWKWKEIFKQGYLRLFRNLLQRSTSR